MGMEKSVYYTFINQQPADGRGGGSHHVPGEVGQPVDGGVDAANELQVLGFANALLDEEEDKAGGDEGHGEDDADGHHHVGGAGGPARTAGRREEGVSGDGLAGTTTAATGLAALPRWDSLNSAMLTSKLAEKSGVFPLNNRPRVFTSVLILYGNLLGTDKKRLAAVLDLTRLPVEPLAY